ncbi:MAG: M13 family metallopeptidase [Paludibacteraceae bacterium]|nr:M13 family metallopeptidase [Paludibacteraceae bacterium]
MKNIVSLFALVLVMTACSNKKNAQNSGIDLSNLDTTAVAQDDFYQYACGGWMKNHPLTGEYSRFGSFDKLAEDNREQLNSLISDIAKKKDNKVGSVEQKIGDLYNLAMDSTRLNAEGYSPIQKEIDLFRNATKENLATLLGKTRYGMFELYVDADPMNSSINLLQTYQSGYALGEREYYLDTDEHTTEIRAKYLKHVERMFALCGFDTTTAQQSANTVLRMETCLAKAAYDNIKLRDPQANYNKMSIDELKTLVPQFDWEAYFAARNITTNQISVSQIEHLQETGKMFAEESIDDLRTYFIWQVINSSASFLSDEISSANFDFYGKVLSGKQEQSPRWKRAVSIVNGTLGEAVGQMYVAKYFPPQAKERMIQLVKNLQISLGERIENLTWMGDSTKTKALEKLNTFYVKIGYPDKWRDYSGLKIDPNLSYYENLSNASEFEDAYSMSFIDKPVDKDKWYMTPQTVNAYYNPSTNEICFPAGILQYPFFDMNADDAFNYGAIGVVIGHEMTHGFDDQGCQFDKDGNLNNWWTADDKKEFDNRAQVLVDYFNAIEVAPGVFANGQFTLGENIADHGGLQVSFQAMKNATKESPLDTIDGLSPEQRFFLAYANVWAGNIREEEILVRTKGDPHSLGRWRVNGALPHVSAWYEAFGVTEESPMYLAPEKRVSIW